MLFSVEYHISSCIMAVCECKRSAGFNKLRYSRLEQKDCELMLLTIIIDSFHVSSHQQGKTLLSPFDQQVMG